MLGSIHVLRTVLLSNCMGRYDAVRLLAELPPPKLFDVVMSSEEVKGSRLLRKQPKVVTFFAVELLDALARRRDHNGGTSLRPSGMDDRWGVLKVWRVVHWLVS